MLLTCEVSSHAGRSYDSNAQVVRGISIDVGELIAELDRASHKESASILIVDDEPANLRLIEIYLRNDGYEDITLCDRPELVPSLVELHQPDAILLDIMMPRVSGLDLLASLRRDSATRHVPVIMLTALTDRRTKSQALELGANDFLTKPFDSFDLLSRVRNALVWRAHQQHLAHQATILEEKVRQRTAELTWTQIKSFTAWPEPRNGETMRPGDMRCASAAMRRSSLKKSATSTMVR